MKDSKVLISILNWNSPVNTRNTIVSVQKSYFKNYKIIIIDNNSIDNSVEVLKEAFPLMQIIKLDTNLGYAGGHKISAKIAQKEGYDLLWMLNNDVVVLPSTLEELIAAFKRHGESLYGGVSLESDNFTISFGGGLELNSENHFDETLGYNIYAGQNINNAELKEREVSGVEGSSFLIPLSIIKKYGFLDTNFFLYGEETEYCYRLRLLHKIPTIIVPKSRLIHYGGQSFKSVKLKWVRAYYLTRNNNIVLNKYLKNFKISEMSGSSFLKYCRFFFTHFLLIPKKQKDFDYWLSYYTTLGNFHSFLRVKGKYLDPDLFL